MFSAHSSPLPVVESSPSSHSPMPSLLHTLISQPFSRRLSSSLQLWSRASMTTTQTHNTHSHTTSMIPSPETPSRSQNQETETPSRDNTHWSKLTEPAALLTTQPIPSTDSTQSSPRKESLISNIKSLRSLNQPSLPSHSSQPSKRPSSHSQPLPTISQLPSLTTNQPNTKLMLNQLPTSSTTKYLSSQSSSHLIWSADSRAMKVIKRFFVPVRF